MKPLRDSLNASKVAGMVDRQPIVPVIHGDSVLTPIQPPKRCSRCKGSKPREEFSKNINAYDGLQNWCKPCTREYARNHRLAKQAHEVL